MPSPPRPRRYRLPAPVLLLALLLAVLPALAAGAGQAAPEKRLDSALLAIAEELCLDLMAQESVHRWLNSTQLAALTGINPRLADGGTSLTFFENGIAYCRSGDKALWASFTLEAGSRPAIIDALESPPIHVHEVWFRRIAPPSTATAPARLQAPEQAGIPAPGGGPQAIIPRQDPGTGPGRAQGRR